VYEKDLGSIDDVPIIAIYIDSVFAGTETSMITIDGIFQISENCLPVQAGDAYGEMEVTSTSGDRIVMQNYDDIALKEGKTINLMGDIKLVVADNETLRFAPVRVLTEPGTYEVRGAVVRQLDEYQSTEIVWNASNSAFLWYDIDSDASSETLTIAPGTLAGYNRTIYEDALSYATHPVYQEYELHENEGLTVDGNAGYHAEGWMGRRCVAAGGRADRLCELLLEFEDTDKKTLLVGEGWDLGGGFTLTPKQIDLDGDKVWLTLNKDGVELDSTVVSSGEVCTCTVDIGDEDDVPIFSCYVDAVFRGTDSNLVQVKYVFLINDDPLEIDAGDRFERMRVVTASSGEVVLKNDVIVSLEPGITEKVMDEMYFRTAKDSTTRFYPFMKRTIYGASGGGGGGTYPPGWNATPPAGGGGDGVIFGQYLRVNEGVEINYDLRIEVAEVSETIVDSAKFRISSYMMPEKTYTIFEGDTPTEYKTNGGTPIRIDVISVQGKTVFFEVTGPDEWRVTDYYAVEQPDESLIPAKDSDRDGVPDAWDKEPDTPDDYRTDSDGRGQRWGDMNRDGRLTSVDAMMLLKMATGSI
jgi:S-layer protein (TIGR01567 family)